MSDLFGAPSGDIAFHQDQDQQVATQQRFAQIQHLGALTEQAQMQTRMEGMKLQREEKMLQIAAQMGQPKQTDANGTPINTSDLMSEYGTRLMVGGMFKEGSGVLNTASEIKQREVMGKAAADRAKAGLQAIRQKKMDSFNNLLAGSNDEDSAAAARMIWLNENPGDTLPPFLQTYNPTVIDVLKKVAKSGQAEVKANQAATNEAEKERYRRDIVEERRRRDAEQVRRDAALADYRERNLAQRKKTGGGKMPTVGSPKNTDLQAAQSMILRDYPNIPADMPLGSGKDSPLISSAAYDLANEAKAAMAKNRGLSMTEAMTQAYGRMKQSGDFRITPKDPSTMDKILNRKPPDKQEYKPAAKEAPIRYIKGQTKLEEGKVYDLGDGARWKRVGDKMVSVE